MSEDCLQLEVFPTDLELRRVDAAKNRRHFYKMTVQRDLFGGASLIRVSGRIGTKGRVQSDFHKDEGRAISALMAIAQQKRRSGYKL
jgi:predicted DNA-binding WGR domain protein